MLSAQTLLKALKKPLELEMITARAMAAILHLSLAKGGQMDFRDLKHAIGISGPAMSRTASFLGDHGLTKRERLNDYDKRQVTVILLPNGAAFARAMCEAA